MGGGGGGGVWGLWRMLGVRSGGGGWIACVVGWVVWDVMLVVFWVVQGSCNGIWFSGWETGRGRMFCHCYEEFWGFYGRRLCIWRYIMDLLEPVSNKKLDRTLFWLITSLETCD